MKMQREEIARDFVSFTSVPLPPPPPPPCPDNLA